MVERILYALSKRSDAWHICTWDHLFIEGGSISFDRDSRMFIDYGFKVLKTWN